MKYTKIKSIECPPNREFIIKNDFKLFLFALCMFPGVPDVYGIKDGVSIWVELKVITSNKINLSPFQIAWNYKHSLQGGRNFIIATTPSRSLLYIFPGSVVHSIGSIATLPSPHWSITLAPGPGSWQQVQRILLHSPLPKPEAPSQ